MNYITLYDNREATLLEQLNSSKYINYEVITILKDTSERHVAYLRRITQQLPPTSTELIVAEGGFTTTKKAKNGK